MNVTESLFPSYIPPSQREVAFCLWHGRPEICHCPLAGSSALGTSDQSQVLDSKSLSLLPAMGTVQGGGMGPVRRPKSIITLSFLGEGETPVPKNPRGRQGAFFKRATTGCFCAPWLLCKEKTRIKQRQPTPCSNRADQLYGFTLHFDTYEALRRATPGNGRRTGEPRSGNSTPALSSQNLQKKYWWSEQTAVLTAGGMGGKGEEVIKNLDAE